ncbi:tRNA 2-selenouridine(34) synthase MnmH [Paenibacillus motobuensis]|uniref:tRNA 2-selenouridine(34) synthase MnmH n=1 Tax=Paenibacillus TaxID=44249 RepID=UPI002040CE9B|nr:MULTISPECIES: tRNA 2-selenouridine(34) synthase MnmH [Paenibacillus]MCM3041832.1 tRNA 2-selenouridine(34) synthase MnmH [Paenibacillus lutimineralis]MCM3648936.1 tRNA 2-selenouridine(34) synthase MnmH [Paenibacillus motobuensis]
MFQDLSITEWLERKDKEMTMIDVRSPSEYADSSIPGSLNIPLFDDQERAEVGTIYTRVSVEAAKERGLEIVSAKLPRFIRQFAEIEGPKTVFCWRGGMRSKTTATLLSLMDIHVYRLAGGYRDYRKWVVSTLESLDFKPNALVIHGNTGNGKTAILRNLQAKGYPVVDLEGMAGHRGSAFGHIGLQANNQRMFDSLLLKELLLLQHSEYIMLEAESRRIGKVCVPEFILSKKDHGRHIKLDLPLEVRVQNILDDYEPWKYPQECILDFQKIRSKIHVPIAAEIAECLEQGIYARAVELLLLHYYDKRYAYSEKNYAESDFITITADTMEEAEQQLEQLLQESYH